MLIMKMFQTALLFFFIFELGLKELHVQNLMHYDPFFKPDFAYMVILNNIISKDSFHLLIIKNQIN